ncbi:MAG: hypothetical protein AB8F74_03670 [Saprospiraceae bacterium]
MKKVIAILLAVHFLIGSLSPKMDFQQLFHVVCAVEHFSFHQQEAADSGIAFTVFDFIMDHYLDPVNAPQNSPDHEEHPCSHSHNHTIDFAKLPLTFPSLQAEEENLDIQVIAIIPLPPSEDFTSGLDEPPSNV